MNVPSVNESSFNKRMGRQQVNLPNSVKELYFSIVNGYVKVYYNKTKMSLDNPLLYFFLCKIMLWYKYLT